MSPDGLRVTWNAQNWANNRALVVGADSMGTRGTSNLKAEPFCKIAQINDVFFAYAGLIENPETGFSTPQLATNAIQKGGAIFDIANIFESIALAPVAKELERTQRLYPDYFRTRFLGKSVVEVVFFGLEKREPIFFLRFFETVVSPNGTITLITKREDCPIGCKTAGLYLGQNEAIKRFEKTNPNLLKDGPVKAVRTLISIEIADKPNDVGPPIDVLHITKRGAEWIQKKPECTEKKKSKNHG